MPTLAPPPAQDIDEVLAQTTAAASERRRLRRARQKKIIVAAVIGSILLHLLLVPVILWAVAHWPRKPLKPGVAPFQLSIVRSNEDEKKDAAAPPKPADQYIRTNEEQQSEKPEDPNFISDKDTKAAAEKAAEANKPPLPSQDGREIPSYDFDTRPYRPGKEASNAATAAAAPSAENAPATPNQTPQPDKKSTAQDSKTKTNPRKAAPTPTPEPGGELASMKAEPTPANEPPRPEDTPSNTPPPPMARSTNQPASRANTASSVSSIGQPRPPGYQPQTIQSRISGSVNNRGRPAPSAINTPLGRYQKGVQDAIGSMWYMEVERQMSYLVNTSEVKLHFYITRSGRVRNIRVEGGNANGSLATVSIGAVNEADIAPIPPEVADMLPGGELEMDFGFNLYLQ